jgi:hypothetical protein
MTMSENVIKLFFLPEDDPHRISNLCAGARTNSAGNEGLTDHSTSDAYGIVLPRRDFDSVENGSVACAGKSDASATAANDALGSARRLGASRVDRLDDLFPGSGAIGRAWTRYTGTR